MKSLTLRNVELKEANDFVEQLHRHHRRVQGHRFSLGAFQDGKMVGVAIVERPVGGQHQRDWVEVTRLCTDGTSNACSFLYGAAARAAKTLGYKRIQTFILQDEQGASLRAAGWVFDRLSHPAGWHHDGQNRRARHVPDHLKGRKQLWYRDLTNGESVPKNKQSVPIDESLKLRIMETLGKQRWMTARALGKAIHSERFERFDETLDALSTRGFLTSRRCFGRGRSPNYKEYQNPSSAGNEIGGE